MYIWHYLKCILTYSYANLKLMHCFLLDHHTWLTLWQEWVQRLWSPVAGTATGCVSTLTVFFTFHMTQWLSHTMFKMRWNMTFSLMWSYWYQHCCHMKLTVSSIAPFCSYVEDNWNKVSHDSWSKKDTIPYTLKHLDNIKLSRSQHIATYIINYGQYVDNMPLKILPITYETTNKHNKPKTSGKTKERECYAQI